MSAGTCCTAGWKGFGLHGCGPTGRWASCAGSWKGSPEGARSGDLGSGSRDGSRWGGSLRQERLGCERCLFFMALASGWNWEAAVRDLGGLGAGWFSADGRCFFPCGQAEPEARAQGSIAGEGCWVLGNSESGDCYRVRVGNRWVVSVAGDYDMRPAGEDFGGATMVVPKDQPGSFFHRDGCQSTFGCRWAPMGDPSYLCTAWQRLWRLLTSGGSSWAHSTAPPKQSYPGGTSSQGPDGPRAGAEIGRASCRERV